MFAPWTAQALKDLPDLPGAQRPPKGFPVIKKVLHEQAETVPRIHLQLTLISKIVSKTPGALEDFLFALIDNVLFVLMIFSSVSANGLAGAKARR